MSGLIGDLIVLPWTGPLSITPFFDPIWEGLFLSFGLKWSLVFVLCFTSIGLMVFLVYLLAPLFQGTQSGLAATKVAVFSYTPTFVCGVFAAAPKPISTIGMLIALFSIYLLYLSLPRIVNCPQQKSLPYTAAVLFGAALVSALLVVVTASSGTGKLLGADGGAMSYFNFLIPTVAPVISRPI